MNRLLILAAAATMLGVGELTHEFVVDPPVNLQATSPGTMQIGHVHVSGTVLAGTFFGSAGGSTTKVVSGWATSPTGFVFGGRFPHGEHGWSWCVWFCDFANRFYVWW